MTARLDITPKTTEQNRIVCASKSEAEVTNNTKLHLRYCTIDATKLTTDRHEASRGLFTTAELLVFQWISAARQTRLVAVPLSIRKLLLALDAAYGKTPAFLHKRGSPGDSDRVNWERLMKSLQFEFNQSCVTPAA